MKKNNQLVTTVRDLDRKTKKLKEETDAMVENCPFCHLFVCVHVSCLSIGHDDFCIFILHCSCFIFFSTLILTGFVSVFVNQ